MKVLVTAGSTQIPIDQVRCISNIFKGRTGGTIAQYFASRGDQVTLITSLKFTYHDMRVIYFHTYDELLDIMRDEIIHGQYDAVIHSAAVSDYRVAGVHVMEDGSLQEIDSSAKISSAHDEIFLRMVPTEKIIDKIRCPWDFNGILVKFKLQVDMSDDDLIEISQDSRLLSRADIIVANCLEWMRERAFILGDNGLEKQIERDNLPNALHEEMCRRIA